MSSTAFRGRPMPSMMMRNGGGAPMMAFRSMAVESVAMPMGAAGPPPAVAQLKKPERVRKLFPEAWLWSTQKASYVASLKSRNLRAYH